MENLFKFYDELSLEDHVYFRIRSEKRTDETMSSQTTPDELPHLHQSILQDQKDIFVEVRWQRGKKPFSWAYRTNPQGDWQPSSTMLLEGALRSLGISSTVLKRELIQQILVQIVHAQMVVEVGEKLLGDKVIGIAYMQTKSFLNSVRKMAESFVQPSPNEGQINVNSDPQGRSLSKRGVRLVYSQRDTPKNSSSIGSEN